MKYFLHDSNSFNDEKITELFISFGYEGLGLFYTILEKLALQEKPVKTSVLKSQLKVGKKLEKCWNFMESLELISSNNGETFNKQLINFSGKYSIKKEKNAKRISEWREKQEVTKNVTHYEQVGNTHKVNESKVKENKEDEIFIASSPIVFQTEIDELKSNVLNDQIQIDNLGMRHGLTPVKTLSFIDKFCIMLKSKGEKKYNPKEFSDYLGNWIGTELKKESSANKNHQQNDYNPASKLF